MVRIRGVVAVLSVAVALTGYLPLFTYLDPLARWFFPASLGLGIVLERRGASPGGRVLTPLSLILFAYYAWGLSLSSVVAVTSNLLVVLLAVRMLGEKSGRNYLQIFGLSLFCLAASSLYSLSALFLGYLLTQLLLLAVSLVILTFQEREREAVLTRFQLRRVLTVALSLPVASLPLMLVFFFVLPRTPYPFWNFLNAGAGRQVGFTETVRPGLAASVSTPKTVAFRALCKRVPDEKLYWRGIVLNGYSGDGWVRLRTPDGEEDRLPAGPLVEQEVFPEPSSQGYLMALNLPRKVFGISHRSSADLTFTGTIPANKRLSYHAYSVLGDSLGTPLGIDRSFYLLLPRTVPSRIRLKASEFSHLKGSELKLQAVERFFRSQRLSYATTALPVGNDALDSFLFQKRRGNCEFFASSLALMLRLSGVPARLVGGYHGGIYSEVGGYYLVTEDMAHVWVEAFVEGKGWVEVDPSAWSQGFARGEGGGARLRLFLDLMGFYWNKAVVTYDLERQISLVRQAAEKVRGFSVPLVPRKSTLTAALALTCALLVIWWLLRVRPASLEKRLIRGFFRVVARRYPGALGENRGIYEVSRYTGDPALKAFAALYGAALYQDRRLTREEFSRCRMLLKGKGEHPA